ncbi:MAG: porin [Verrucomicrobia bacterium]|nr:porin [Verrucomicrobiota bacterium]
MKRDGLCAVVTTSVILVAGAVQGGPRWEVSDDAYIQMGMLGQVHVSVTEGAAAEHDIYLRRARLILFGQVFDGVKFFMETDNDNAGRSGTSGVSTDIQDAFVEQRLLENHYLQGGLLLLPFSFENASSAASLLGLDYNLETLKFVETFAWRDYGVIIRGDFGKRLAYRVGAFDGYDDKSGTKNPDAHLRFTGHVALSLVGEAETGWFFTQERLGDEAYLTVGAGFDSQDNASLIPGAVVADAPAAEPLSAPQIKDSEAFVVDFQSGFPLVGGFATINGAWQTWDNVTFDGDTAFLEAGLRKDAVQFGGKVSFQDPVAKSSTTDTTIGLYHYRKRHSARAGIEYRWGDSASQVLVGMQVSL